jgi:hypothetical protein
MLLRNIIVIYSGNQTPLPGAEQAVRMIQKEISTKYGFKVFRRKLEGKF